MSRYQYVSQRASRFASGCAESLQTADSFGGGLSRMKMATIAPTASTAARLATNGHATAPSAALRVRWGTVCIVEARDSGLGARDCSRGNTDSRLARARAGERILRRAR